MPNPTLFPLAEPITPSPERQEPTLWLKRLVILPELDAADPIRDIVFRRGLNIVQTRRRYTGEDNVVGHSVGKTLLMRLIRYTLGEQHFAVAQVRARIANILRHGRVVAHWRVNCVDWIVARPMQEGRSMKSVAVRGDDWRAAISNEDAHEPFAGFLAAVDGATLSGLSEFTLPRARRSPKWSDVLGWLARDFECGYRAPNDWRHDDADSGPSLDRDDNSVILQWMSGLMGAEEIALKQRHHALLDERQTAKADRDSAQKTIDVSGPILFARLELPDDREVVDDAEGLFAVRTVEMAKAKIESLTRLIEERRAESAIEALELAEKNAQASVTAAEAQVLEVVEAIAFVKGRIAQIDVADSRDGYGMGSPYENCPSEPCPMRLANRASPSADPARDSQLSSLREELAEAQRSRDDRVRSRDDLKTAHANAVNSLQIESDRLALEKAGIDQAIGRWQGYQSDAESYSQARKTFADSVDTIESLDARIEESSQAQESVRQNLRARLNRLSACYDKVLKAVFGEKASGRISVDGKGLHPMPDHRLAPNGAALSVMTTVLAFDISSLAASASGVGHHPRLLLHDSPREGDMEEPLFHRLFETARALELLFGQSEPSFQYIVTTTTPPPPELADESGPYVRLTLDARTDAGHLLCTSF
jgi:hypothetical protein